MNESKIENSDNYNKAVQKVKEMGDEDLSVVWKNLQCYDSTENYDEGVTMDAWANLISTEMDVRNLSKE